MMPTENKQKNGPADSDGAVFCFLERFTFEKGEDAGRRCAAAFLTRRRGTAMRVLSRAFPFPVILLNKARWGRGSPPP